MKIGVIGATQRCGKTTTMLALAHCFAMSQRKRACMFSTDSLVHVLKDLLERRKDKDASTIGVFEAMLKTGYVKGEGMYDYAVRTSKANTFVFDVFDTSKKSAASFDFLIRSIELLDADLTLIEITGDPTDVKNADLLKTCHRIIYIFNQDNYSITKMNDYRNSLTARVLERYCFICANYDDAIISTKKLSAITKLPQNELFTLGYNPVLQKLIFEYDYIKLAEGICYGNPELLPLRQQLCAIMQFLFDDEKYKRILQVKDWPKNPMGVYR